MSNNVPKLRFKGFEDEWKEKKLGEISEITKLAGFEFTKYVQYSDSGSIIALRGLNVKNGKINLDDVKYIDNSDFSKLNRSKLYVNDLLFTYVGTIGDVAIVNENNKYYLAPNVCRIRINNNNSYLVKLLISSDRFYKKIIIPSITTSSQPALSMENIRLFNIIIPSIEEQEKIANFLTKVDKIIEKQEEKVSNLENYKKGMMQKIFSQEIRFKDENREEYPKWEKKRLGEIGFFKTSSVDKLMNEDEKLVKLVNYMDVYRHIELNNEANFSVVSAKDTQILENNLLKGDILFTPSSETPEDIGHSCVIFEDLINTVYSYHLIRFRPNIEINILYSHYFCNVDKVRNQIVKYATGSTRFTVSLKSFEKILVELPCLEEQTKIADCLSKIDLVVEKEREKLEELRLWKKGLLQQMFV